MEGTLSPTFDETLEFRGIFGEMATSGVAFELFDKDLLKADDLLGEVHVSLEALQSAATHEYSKPLSFIIAALFWLMYMNVMWIFLSNVLISVLLDKFLSARGLEEEILANMPPREAPKSPPKRGPETALTPKGRKVKNVLPVKAGA